VDECKPLVQVSSGAYLPRGDDGVLKEATTRCFLNTYLLLEGSGMSSNYTVGGCKTCPKGGAWKILLAHVI